MTRNRHISETAKIAKLGDELSNGRLKWFQHFKRREEEYVGGGCWK